MAVTTELSLPKPSEAHRNENDRVIRRKSEVPKEASEGVRYFLAKENGLPGLPQLGKEFSSEKEALIESLRTGLSFFAVSEWKAVAL
jgi:hypothetical protein